MAAANDRKNDVEGHHSKVGMAAWNRLVETGLLESVDVADSLELAAGLEWSPG